MKIQIFSSIPNLFFNFIIDIVLLCTHMVSGTTQNQALPRPFPQIFLSLATVLLNQTIESF